MRIAGIVRDSIVDGPGIRDVVFFQGCPHQCKDCHNPDTHSVHGGKVVTVDEVVAELSGSSNDLTISGGEPLLQSLDLRTLLGRLKRRTWLYTGFNVTQMSNNTLWDLYMGGVEVIVDGKFEEDKKDPTLRFRGSSNQRIIDLGKTLTQGEIVLWEDEYEV